MRSKAALPIEFLAAVTRIVTSSRFNAYVSAP